MTTTSEFTFTPELVGQVAQVVCRMLGVDDGVAPWMNEMGRRIQLAPRDDISSIEQSWVELYAWVERLVAGEEPYSDDGLVATYRRRAAQPQFAAVDDALIELPVGVIVYPHINAANRDPAVFDDPLRIDPTRPGGRHLQYGYGMHRCMGSALSQIELITVLETLVTRFPDLRLAVAPEAIEWDFGIGLRRPTRLLVTLRQGSAVEQ